MSSDPTFSTREESRGWRERLGDIAASARALLATRSAIFRKELDEKARLAARGALALAVAGAFALLALLVFTAFLAVLLTNLLGSATLGILVVFLLYAAVAVAAGLSARKSLSQIRPGDFPVTREELRKDLEAIRTAQRAQEEAQAPEEGGRARSTAQEDLELEGRFRAGSE